MDLYQNALQKYSLEEWRRLRREQDEEFEQTLQADREKVCLSFFSRYPYSDILPYVSVTVHVG